MKKTPLRKVSRKRAGQNKLYLALFPAFFAQRRYCEVPDEVHNCTFFATPPPHHMKGRTGDLLVDTKFWLPTCMNGHRWIEENKKKARKLGLILYP